MKSWRTTILKMIIFSLILVILSNTIVHISYIRRLDRTYDKEYQNMAQIWSDSTMQRLNAVSQHLRSATLEMFRNGLSIREGTPQMSFFEQSEYLDFLQSKQLVSSDISLLFLQDQEKDVILMSSNKRISNHNSIAIRTYLKSKEYPYGSFYQNQWSLVEIDEKNYFISVIRFGKYCIGAMCSLDAFDFEKEFYESNPKVNLSILQKDQLYAVHGETGQIFVEDCDVQAADPYVRIVELQIEDTNMTAVLTTRVFSVEQILKTALPEFFLVAFITVLLLFLLAISMQKQISKPIKELIKATKEIQGGNLNYRIQKKASDEEFAALFRSFNGMLNEIEHLKIEAYDRQIQKQKDELAMLRAQIRPHFYLNAITTVSNMTYDNRMEDIRVYLSSLARYMRYMLDLQGKFVTVGEELDHIENYIEMQKLKFPDSVEATIACADGVRNIQVPYLIIFTVIENTFKHAMNLYSTLELEICCKKVHEDNFDGCVITVSDNGEGFADKVLEMFRPESGLPEAKNHFGLTNVNRTLQLSYHRQDLLRLKNKEDGGAVVELWIPDSIEEQEGK